MVEQVQEDLFGDHPDAEFPGEVRFPDWEYGPAATTSAVLTLTELVMWSPAAVASAPISALLMFLSPVKTTRPRACRVVAWVP